MSLRIAVGGFMHESHSFAPHPADYEAFLTPAGFPTLDPHVNLTARMVAEADALTPYRTYPHVDMRETGERAYDLLIRRRALGRPFAKAFRAIDYLTPITSQCTLVEPMSGLMAERA